MKRFKSVKNLVVNKLEKQKSIENNKYIYNVYVCVFFSKFKLKVKMLCLYNENKI